MKTELDILFLGDIVGRPGRFAVKYFIENIETFIDNKPDFTIVNCENASHGFGLTEKNYNELSSLEIDVLTSGNHIWDRKEIFNYIDNADKLIRPLNYPSSTPGKGSLIVSKNGSSIGVINLLGRIFMDPYESPWEIVKSEIIKLQTQTPIIIIDFHAEATAEKMAFFHYISELGVTAMFGTHTHVQTADEKIYNSTAYITDAGYCGASNSIIGMDISSSLCRLTSLLPSRYEIPVINETTINGVLLSVNQTTGIPTKINRININFNLKNIIEEGKL